MNEVLLNIGVIFIILSRTPNISSSNFIDQNPRIISVLIPIIVSIFLIVQIQNVSSQ